MNNPCHNLTCYLVGGSVRDELLGISSSDKDWVVVGSTSKEMLQRGFLQVGKDFPVFLHPKTKEEYALARREQKIASGYTGFSIDSRPTITLKEDLSRRDLTINAIAKKPNGELVDPFHGVEDLKARIIRHTSDAFCEDPIRILRVARFMARYHCQGFTIAKSTLNLMRKLTKSNELSYLVPERIWLETSKALAEKNPVEYFRTLEHCEALSSIFPEFFQLSKLSEENDYLEQSFTLLKNISNITPDARIRFASLFFEFSKFQSSSDTTSYVEVKASSPYLNMKNLCNRIKAPNSFKTFCSLIVEHNEAIRRLKQLSSCEVLELLNNIDAFRRSERVFLIDSIYLAFRDLDSDIKSTKISEDFILRRFFDVADKVNKSDLANFGSSNDEKREELDKRRIKSISSVNL